MLGRREGAVLKKPVLLGRGRNVGEEEGAVLKKPVVLGRGRVWAEDEMLEKGDGVYRVITVKEASCFGQRARCWVCVWGGGGGGGVYRVKEAKKLLF